MPAIMLDTCGLIWLVNGGGRISEDTLKVIETADIVYVSAATAFEIGCKAVLKKLDLPMDAEKWYGKVLSTHDLVEIPITGKIALFSTSLPPVHKDPADRMIIATAILNRVPVVTHDSRFNQYPVEVLR
jgi:PIN domain nuclease of toxin-antitoxin system